MRLAHLLFFGGLGVAALLASPRAFAFSVTTDAGLNQSGAGNFVDPDQQAAHLADGGGPSLSASWGDRPIPSAGSVAGSDPASGSSALPSGTRWSDSWFAPSLIIAGKWHYPSSAP